MAVSRQRLHQWANDTNKVPSDELPDLCATLECSIEWLLTGKESFDA
jgi:DNA-binding Xre family transcriptional regulator